MTLTSPSDDHLREAVRQALASDNRTAGLQLRVGVLNGVTHLGGKAPSAELWRRAEVVAARVEGVRGVVNRIEAPDAPSPLRVINLPLNGPEGTSS